MECCFIDDEYGQCGTAGRFELWIPEQGHMDTYFYACREHLVSMLDEDAEYKLRTV